VRARAPLSGVKSVPTRERGNEEESETEGTAERHEERSHAERGNEEESETEGAAERREGRSHAGAWERGAKRDRWRAAERHEERSHAERGNEEQPISGAVWLR
jgi:hypothetical protein